MFKHPGLRPLWAALLFAPWLILGIAYLLQALRHARGRAAHLHR